MAMKNTICCYIFIMLFTQCVFNKNADLNEPYTDDNQGEYLLFPFQDSFGNSGLYLLKELVVCDSIIFGTEDIIQVKRETENQWSLFYRVRGGSNVKERVFGILTCHNNKLFHSLSIYALSTGELTMAYNKMVDSLNFYEYSKYQVDVSVRCQDSIFLTEDFESISKLWPDGNEQWKMQHLLYFDKNEYVYFNKKIKLNGNYSFVNTIGDSFNRKFENQYVSAVKLYENAYYYIDYVWYIYSDGEFYEFY